MDTPAIAAVTRHGNGYLVDFEGRTGFWSALYGADGTWVEDIWPAERPIVWLDPGDLARRAT